MNSYKIYYCGEETGTFVDKVKARNPKEAIEKLLNPIYFEAKEVKEKK